MRFLFLLAALVATVSSVRAAATPPAPPLPEGLYAEVTTPRGVITCKLFYRQAPLMVTNFVGLAEGTLGPAPRKPFYDGLTFHRVSPGFVVQGGDPLGTGEGGPGYRIPDEFGRGLHFDTPGMLAMANSGPDTNGSQFFFTLSEVNRLNYLHSIFGRVIRGLNLLPDIREDDKMRVKILRIGADAQAFQADDAAFASQLEKARRYTGPRTPGPSAPFADPDRLLDPARAEAFNFKLANLERATGLKLSARILRKPPAAEGKLTPEEIAQHEAQQLGLAEQGVLALYLADSDRWALAIAEPLLATFNPASGDQAAARKKFLADMNVRAEAYTTKMAESLPPRQTIPRAMKIKYHFDAVLDGLILRLEPK